MTDTAREAAIERVRAYVEACSKRPDNWLADELGPRDDYLTLTLGDLRLLLTDPRQPSEAPVTADEGWKTIESAPRDGTLFLAWQTIPTLDEDTRCTTREGSPCIAQTVFGSVASIPMHYVPQGQRITHWRPLPPAPPTGEGEPQGEES